MAKNLPFPELMSWGPDNWRKAKMGCSHTEDYVDEKASIVCVGGWMIDIDTYTEGFNKSDFKHPCPGCNKALFVQWAAAEMWQEGSPDEKIHAWIAQQTGVPADRCTATPDMFSSPASS